MITKYFDKNDFCMIIDALESYQLDIEHGEENGHSYPYTVDDVQAVIETMEEVLDVEYD
jgi:hypothetical protein